MKILLSSMLVLSTFFTNFLAAQESQPPQDNPLIQLMDGEVGEWKAEMKMWMNEQGQADPNAQPTVAQGEEKVRMIGEYWQVSDFSADLGGIPFVGHSVVGYNPKSKKIEGTWYDSMTPVPSKMSGTYDPKTKTQSFTMEKPMPDGSVSKSKSVVIHSDGKRLFTMYDMKPGSNDEWIKSMEVTYTRKPEVKK